MSSSSCRAQREPLSLMPPQPRVPAWLPALASEMSPFTVDEPWGPRCGGGVAWGGNHTQLLLKLTWGSAFSLHHLTL